MLRAEAPSCHVGEGGSRALNLKHAYVQPYLRPEPGRQAKRQNHPNNVGEGGFCVRRGFDIDAHPDLSTTRHVACIRISRTNHQWHGLAHAFILYSILPPSREFLLAQEKLLGHQYVRRCHSRDGRRSFLPVWPLRSCRLIYPRFKQMRLFWPMS